MVKFFQSLLESALRHKPYSTKRIGPKTFPTKQGPAGLSMDFSKTKNSGYLGMSGWV